MTVEPEDGIVQLLCELRQPVLGLLWFRRQRCGQGQQLSGRQRAQADEPLDRTIAVSQNSPLRPRAAPHLPIGDPCEGRRLLGTQR